MGTIRSAEAAQRLSGVLRRTPLEAFRPAQLDARIELRLKLECQQETGSFKSRGAWNSLARLSSEERARGVVATSSGNHGRALAWAAARAGVRATLFMPATSFPNKIAACRELGAEVVLTDDRAEAERRCAEKVASGAVLVHPYDADATIEGAGTVGLEIAEEWPEVEICVVPIGGGGLAAGSSLALRQALGSLVRVYGAEPAGAATMSRALEAGRPVCIEGMDLTVQGLCPMAVGERNLAICADTLDGVLALANDEIFAAQRLLVAEGGYVVEPAGAASTAAVLSQAFPRALYERRSRQDPLRVCAVVSGGNPDPEQLASLRA